MTKFINPGLIQTSRRNVLRGSVLAGAAAMTGAGAMAARRTPMPKGAIAASEKLYKTAGEAAAAGGVTTMVIRPDTLPAIDNPEVLEFVHRRAVSDAVVRVLPMAALTRDRVGKEMAELGLLMDAYHS